MNTKARETHPLAGKTVTLRTKDSELNGQEYVVEDWWINVGGKSWMHCDGNWACLHYAMRNGTNGGPIDDEVLYGKVGAFGKLVHVSEIEAMEGAAACPS